MNETIRTHLAELNAAWQRYAKTANDQLDSATAEALNRDYVKAWEGLDACGIAEWMLVYDPTTLTFSLPETTAHTDNAFATLPMPAVTNQPARHRWRSDHADPDGRLIS